MRPLFRWSLLIFSISLCGLASPAAAQSRPYTLTDVLQLLQGGVAPGGVLDRVRKSCVTFRVTSDVENVLKGAGADGKLLSGIRSACYRGDDTRSEKRIIPPVVEKTVVKHDTIAQTVIKHDTVVVYRPVVARRPVVTVAVNADLHDGKGLLQSDSNCERGYIGDLYYLKRPPGSSAICGIYWRTPDTSATAVAEASFARAELTQPYAYGVAFGVDDSSSYNFQIQVEGGIAHQRLVRLVRGKWIFLTRDAESSTIDLSGNNRMKVEISDAGIKMYINDRLVGTYNPPIRIRGNWFGAAQYGSNPGRLFVNGARFTEMSADERR